MQSSYVTFASTDVNADCCNAGSFLGPGSGEFVCANNNGANELVPNGSYIGSRTVNDGSVPTTYRDRVTGVGYQPDSKTRASASRLHRRYGYRFAKRTFDIAFSLLVLVLFWWVYVIVAIAIKVDDPAGPVFFVQERMGKNEKPFNMFKFRSMYADAEERLAELKELNEKDGPVFKIKDDPRITRVGRFIRKTSMASVIIGTPGDGKPTKSLSHPENSSLDLQKCERRPGTSLGERHHYTSFQFLSFAVFGSPEGTSGRSLCAIAQTPFASVGTAA
ncbi:MAG: sugar transferase [Olsenella sp.]|nr:sugar transferase [Olsenella sp.]